MGAKKDPEANMWLNPQSWSVISRFASKDQAETAMESVHRILNTPYGAKLLEPPYVDHYFDGALMHIFNPDTKEKELASLKAGLKEITKELNLFESTLYSLFNEDYIWQTLKNFYPNAEDNEVRKMYNNIYDVVSKRLTITKSDEIWV